MPRSTSSSRGAAYTVRSSPCDLAAASALGRRSSGEPEVVARLGSPVKLPHRRADGATALTKSKTFNGSSAPSAIANPVTLPLGFANELTRPHSTGMKAKEKTIGTVRVARTAATAAVCPKAHNTSASPLRRRSSANSGSRSRRRAAYRRSTRTVSPRTDSTFRQAASEPGGGLPGSTEEYSTPTRRTRCPRVATGHGAATVAATATTQPRRFTRSPHRRARV